MESLPKKGKATRMLAGFLGMLVFYVGVQWAINRTAAPEWVPLDDPAGYRMLTTGAVSRGAFDPLVGLSTREARPVGDDRLCEALFFDGTGPGVPVAYFTDFFCPNCRKTEAMLAEAAQIGAITLSRHDWPILGQASEQAARAHLAAGLQNGEVAFRTRLLRAAFVPDETYLRDLSVSAGLDADRLLADMTSPEVEDHLDRAQNVADRFGFYATPSTVIGKTVIIGALDAKTFAAILTAEAQASCR